MTDHVTGGNVGDVNTPDEALNVLIAEADWADMHGGDNHDDECPICRSIAMLRAALNHAYPASNEALNRHAQTMQWQPRETAPKTGKPFLAFFPDGDFTPETGIDVIWWEPSEERFLIGGSPIIWKFTHWTPLPTAPAIPSTLLGAQPSDPASEDRTDGR